MSVMLSIDGLPLALSSEELRVLAEPHGQIVRCWIVTTPGTHTSLGFGYIEAVTDRDAQGIIAALTGEKVNCVPCTVAIEWIE